jgi:hypothetical protein
MLPRQLLSNAVEETAKRLEVGFGGEIAQRERRLRATFAASLAHRYKVAEVRTKPEWQPELPLWPWSADRKHKLGGFDLAIRFQGDEAYSLVCELKWTHYGIVNALDEAMWDAFKLAHAGRTLPGVTHGILLYLAPVSAWSKPARFTRLFDDALTSSRELIAENESIWRWCLREGSAARPNKLPPYLETGLVARAHLLIDSEEWELRMATVASNGEPWLDVDAAGMPLPADSAEPQILDWHSPAPGPGMEADDLDEFALPRGEITETASDSVRLEDVPGPGATWARITWFAAHYNGYAHYGNRALGELANEAVAYWREHGVIQPSLSLDDLRACLFFEYRRYHHFDHTPSIEATPYLRGLVEAIRERVAVKGA